MDKDLYLLSGLGADKMVFQNLDLDEYNVHHISWITPHEDESIEQYSTRLLPQITSPSPIIVGLSFGGMIAVEVAKQMIAAEVAKQIQIEKLILISTAKTRTELPFYIKYAGKLHLHKLLPLKILNRANPISYWLFGITTQSEKKLLKQILNDTDLVFLKWAIDKIVNWQNDTIIKNCFHIHGSSDKLLPIVFTNPDCIIQNGGHFMVLNMADEITSLLKMTLN
jgi:pimeloyl-ACP methyl ester carboxylesterase